MSTEEPIATRNAELARTSDAVCRMGALMLAAGTGSYRVKAAMGRVAQAMGIDHLRAQVSVNEIVATTRVDDFFRTQVVEVPVPHVDADRLGALLRVSLRVRPGLTAEELHRQLDRVEARPHLYPAWMPPLAALLACAAFAFLNNGRWDECVAAGLGAAVGKWCQMHLRRFRVNQLADIALSAFAAGLVYMLLVLAVRQWTPGLELRDSAFTTALLFLVPGFPLLTGAMDLVRFDFASGISRLTYVAMVVLASSVGAWGVAWLFGSRPTEVPADPMAWQLRLALRLLASFVGILGFALIFNTPARIAALAAGVGALANLGRLSGIDAGVNPLFAAGVATTAVGLVVALLTRLVPAPRITLSVPAILIMIPGSSTYRALVAMIDRDPLQALTHATSAASVIVALVGGLTVGRMLTDPMWISDSPSWTHMPTTPAQRRVRRRP